MNMQKKVLARMEGIAKEFGLDFIRNGQLANTGNVQMMDDDFDTYIDFRYNFQSDYFSICFKSNDGSEIKDFIYVKNTDAKEVREIFTFARELLSATAHL